jgi:glycosyltransferase involved in cell wall biosynthesis
LARRGVLCYELYAYDGDGFVVCSFFAHIDFVVPFKFGALVENGKPPQPPSPYTPRFVSYPELLDAIVVDKIRHISSFVCIRRARYVVVPFEWYENNPLSVIEALAVGAPVIGSRIGGIPELIDEGVSGFLGEPASVDSLRATLERVLTLPDEDYRAMCCKGKAFAREHFNQDAYYHRLTSIYKDIINSYNR